MADIDYFKLVEDKKTEREASGINARMDNDRELVEGKKFKLEDVNKKAVPNAISVTLNDLVVFATNVESSLGSATEQVLVESEDKTLDTAYIEEFIKAIFVSADESLKFPLNSFLDQQMCRRGQGAVLSLFRLAKDKKTLITDIVEWDTRFYYSGIDLDGGEWGAYETFKTKDEIASAKWAKKDKFTIEDEEAEVLNVWSKDRNYIWVNDRQVFSQPHPFGEVPVVHKIVPMGSMMADKESRVAQGESIFFLIRDLVPELNRLVSIVQSLNMKELDHALMWMSEDGKGATLDSAFANNLREPGAVTPADIGGGAVPVSFGELKQSANLLHTMIETRIQRGSVSNVDLGIMGNQPWSAVALLQIAEGRDQVFFPRLATRGTLNENLARMAIKQVLLTGATRVDVGSIGHRRTFDTRKLQGEYTIVFKYFIKSPQVDAARSSLALTQRGLIPDHSIRRDTLQREDPDGDERRLRWEEMERLVPAIKMRRGIKSLLEMAERGDEDAEEEAKLVADQLGVTIEQLLSGSTDQTPKPEEELKPTAMLPLFEGGGKGGPARREG